jgi:putative membrane protein
MRAIKLSTEEHEKLRQALADAERRTTARLELTVVRASDKYPLYPMLYGGMAALAALGALAVFAHGLSLRSGFYISAGVFAAVSLILEWLPLRLMLIPKHARAWECWELAHRSFASRVLARNDRKTGILIFVSLGERYIEVVTDRDVDRHIKQDVWDGLIRDFTTAAKEKRIGEGLAAAVETATKVLEGHYPKAG